MKVVMYICAIVWAINFIGLFFGAEPSKVTIAGSFFLSAAFALTIARDL